MTRKRGQRSGLEDHHYLTSVVADLFPRRHRRHDRSQQAQREIEGGDGVVVAETAEERRALAVACMLLAQVREHDGSRVGLESLLCVAERALATLSEADRGPVLEETVTTLDWLADHLVRTKSPAEPVGRGDVHFSTGPRVAKIVKALEGGQDLLIEYFTYHRGEWNERRVTPTKVAGGFLVGHCHLRGEERRFRISRIRSAKVVTEDE